MRKIFELLRRIRLDDGTRHLTKCDILFFCHDVDRGVTLNKKAYSPLLDSVRDYFEAHGLLCLSVAHPFSVLTNEKGHGNPISFNRSYFVTLALKKFLPNKFRKAIEEHLDVYRKILLKTNVKLIITIGSPKELCIAARKQNCFCVELLHGLSHSCLPAAWLNADPGHLPQGILSLSDASAATFSPLTKYGIETKTIPHPFLKRFIGQRLTSVPQEWMLPPVNSAMFDREILVSLMWGYAGDHGPNTEFADILENGLFYKELADVVAESKNIFWRFRFHPVQLRDKKYRHLLSYMDKFVAMHPNAEWRKASSLPLPSVARNCSGNISMASGSCYDLVAMGLRSLMLCPTLHKGGVHEEFFTDLVQEGYVVKASISKDKILYWVNHVEKLPPRLSNLDNEQAWEDAAEWMLVSSGFDSKLKHGTT